MSWVIGIAIGWFFAELWFISSTLRGLRDETRSVAHEISALHTMLERRLPETMLGRFGGCIPSGPSADYAWKATPIPVAVVRLNDKGQWEPEK